jgi:hypothetical protein
MVELTKTSCTAPQKQVAVASCSVDQPSLEREATFVESVHCCSLISDSFWGSRHCREDDDLNEMSMFSRYVQDYIHAIISLSLLSM